jgi:hypothetical protein
MTCRSEHNIRGTIAEQRARHALIRPDRIAGPRGVDETKWLEIPRGEPMVILLDALPPYLLNADTRAVGKGSLADLVQLPVAPLVDAVLGDALMLAGCLH